jgi:cytochrome c oxidase subunit 2
VGDASGVGAASAEQGRVLFAERGCAGCHGVDAGSAGSGPTMEGLYLSGVVFDDGSTRRADEDYLRESILDPSAHVVHGYPDVMPSYRGRLSEPELLSLVLYLESLAPGAGHF